MGIEKTERRERGDGKNVWKESWKGREDREWKDMGGKKGDDDARPQTRAVAARSCPFSRDRSNPVSVQARGFEPQAAANVKGQ